MKRTHPTSERESAARSGQDVAEFSRRRFLAAVASTTAVATMTGCTWPDEHSLPYAYRPDGMEPGVLRHFATSREVAGVGVPLRVTTIDGRPIKVEGNPSHGSSLGAADAQSQAAVYELYDADRSRWPLVKGARVTWAQFEASLAEGMRSTTRKLGEGLVVIAPPTSSPTNLRMREMFIRRFPRCRWVNWDAASREEEAAGLRAAYGQTVRPRYLPGKARVILSLESDLLHAHPEWIRHLREWSDARESNTPPRMYAFESCSTLTGTMADTRIPLRREALGRAAAQVLRFVRAQLGNPLESDAGEDQVLPARLLKAIGQDLVDARGAALVVAGPSLPRELHVVVAALNEVLEAGTAPMELLLEPAPANARNLMSMPELSEGGAFTAVICLGCNPAYDSPKDAGVVKLLKDAEFTVHFGLHVDETAELCQLHGPMAHFLESWGDSRSWDGTWLPIQPVIAPLHDGRSQVELLAHLSGQEKPQGLELAQETWGVPSNWEEFLRTGNGVRPFSNHHNTSGVSTEALTECLDALCSPAGASSKLDVLFVPDFKMREGQFANNAWLQELPDPLTKLTWSNAALVDSVTSAEEGIETGAMIELSCNGRSIELPAYVMPGQAPHTVVLPLGYGRTMKGRAAYNAGWNVTPLRSVGGMWHIQNATMKKAGQSYEFAATTDHFLIDKLGMEERERRGLELVRERPAGGLEAAHGEESPAHHGPHHQTPVLWKSLIETDGDRWAMLIDLNRCNGCSACVVACQAENNIPAVGEEQVRRGREMHWLRIDRVYRGDIENPVIRHMPMTCLQCETAPCEQVCPVAATMHSREGLNEMVYNRCIGTRYCSNNCPVKVRRFNYLNYHGRLDEVEKLRMNPDVTVRNRGVMEKCTLCIQRIARARIDAKVRGIPLQMNSMVPACAQACPSMAIRFGNLKESESDFVRSWKGPRAYEILEELDLRARVKYLKVLTNAHPQLAHGEEHA